MAYIEVWKSDKLLKRCHVDQQKAQRGCRIRIGSAGEVCVEIGRTETIGEFEVRLFEGEPPIEHGGVEDTASLSPDETRDNPGDPLETKDFPTGTMNGYPDIKGYKIIEPLGQGGMGMVWRAEQLSTRREVALKLLVSHRLESPKAQARFQREVELTARLDHPNIARIYDSGLHQGMYYYAMELVDGVPLDKYVKSNSLSRTQRAVAQRAFLSAHLMHLCLRFILMRHRLYFPLNTSPAQGPASRLQYKHIYDNKRG